MDIALKTDDEWTADGNEVVKFRLIRDVKDLESNEGDFKPTMCHQIFGPQERIYGYKNLAIDLYFSAGFLNPYLKITYSDKIKPADNFGLEADFIEEILNEKLQIRFLKNIDEFSRLLENERKFHPTGDLLKSFHCRLDGIERNFLIYKTGPSQPGFLELHSRLQTFLLWFVDSASFIDIDNDKWQFFMMYEKYTSNGETMYAVAGYTTVYEYYAYPNFLRPRISQTLILTPFQNHGLGTELLRTIFDFYRVQAAVLDISVEDPSEEFQVIRDYIDCQALLSNEEIANANPVDFNVIKEVSKNFKINKKQSRRLYEILRLRQINRNNEEEYRQYRLEVKSRLNIPFQCEKKRLKKFRDAVPDLYSEALHGREQRLNVLDSSFDSLQKLYSRVIRRLNDDPKV